MNAIILLLPLLLLVTPAMANAQNTWMYYNSSSHESGQVIVTQSTPNQVEFKDIHGNIIHLMKNNMTGGGMRMDSGVDPRYTSGYQHGVSDGKNPTENYLYKTGGMNKHTKQFDQGYINGWCSVLGSGAQSDVEGSAFDCSVDVHQ